MKLSLLYEFLDIAKSACDFYCDPKAKAAGATKKIKGPPDDMSHLVGGKKDRKRFANKMNKPKRKKK